MKKTNYNAISRLILILSTSSRKTIQNNKTLFYILDIDVIFPVWKNKIQQMSEFVYYQEESMWTTKVLLGNDNQ